LSFARHLSHLRYLYEGAVWSDRLDVGVLASVDLPAGETLSARVSVDGPVTVDCLRKRKREPVLAHAARAGHYQSVTDAALCNRTLQEALDPVITC
jgi:hypothetical protein